MAAVSKQLREIDRKQAYRILLTLTQLGDDPFTETADVKALRGYEGLYRLRVGDYRLVYEVFTDRLVIHLTQLDGNALDDLAWHGGGGARRSGAIPDNRGHTRQQSLLEQQLIK